MTGYTYPDKNDVMTSQLIGEVSRNDYWGKSERLVLERAEEFIRKSAQAEGSRCEAEGAVVGAALDLGCGQGRLLPWLAALASEVTGAEPDPERMKAAAVLAEGLKTAAGQPVSVLCGDVGEAEKHIAPESLDLALSSHVIQHIPMSVTEDMFMRLGSLMKKGGILVMTATISPGAEDAYTLESMKDGVRSSERSDRAGFEAAADMPGVLPVAFYTQNTVKDFMEPAGFELADVWGYHFDVPGRFAGISDDRAFNEAGDLSFARDVMYIFVRR